MSKSIVLAGMHRSGTSLSSSILSKAGLHIGDNLMGAGKGNTEGHFENLDFVEFHESILKNAGLHSDWGLPPKNFKIDESFLPKAKSIIAKNEKELWGWKDPRTTLFLEYWYSLLPNSYFVFLYRSPLEVYDSLIRREDQYFLFYPEKYWEVWYQYNVKVLEFFQKHPEKTIIRHVDQVTNNPHQFILDINQQFGLTLSIDFDAQIKKGMLQKLSAKDSIMESELFTTYPHLLQVYQGLNQACQYPWQQAPGLDESVKALWNVDDWMKFQAYKRAVPTLLNKVDNMKTSKFWKIRNWWFKIKGKDAEV